MNTELQCLDGILFIRVGNELISWNDLRKYRKAYAGQARYLYNTVFVLTLSIYHNRLYHFCKLSYHL